MGTPPTKALLAMKPTEEGGTSTKRKKNGLIMLWFQVRVLMGPPNHLFFTQGALTVHCGFGASKSPQNGSWPTPNAEIFILWP